MNNNSFHRYGDKENIQTIQIKLRTLEALDQKADELQEELNKPDNTEEALFYARRLANFVKQFVKIAGQ